MWRLYIHKNMHIVDYYILPPLLKTKVKRNILGFFRQKKLTVNKLSFGDSGIKRKAHGQSAFGGHVQNPFDKF